MRVLLVALVSLAASVSFAGPLANRAYDIADLIRLSENDLSGNQRSALADSFDQIRNILLNQNPGGGVDPQLACVASGTSYGVQQFRIFVPRKNLFLGDGVPQKTCSELVAKARVGLVCAPSGTSYGVQMFVLTDLTSGLSIGDAGPIAGCQATLGAATRDILCAASGTSYGTVTYRIFNRGTNKWLGDGTSLQMCLTSIGQ